jgi:hypothetical protein
MDAFDLTIFTIATNKYLDYFDLQKDQIAQFIGLKQRTQVVVATNATSPKVEKYRNLTIQYVPMRDLKWPEITLLRYHTILENEHFINGSHIMWLDTDMALVRDVDLRSLLKADVIHFARQPGFYFSKVQFEKLSSLEKLRAVVPWVKARVRCQVGAGTWEDRRKSAAYVPPSKRATYVHGAVWVGSKSEVLAMCKLLAQNVDTDLANGIVARWHDESHLNWFFAMNTGNSLLPPYFSAWDKAWQYSPAECFMLSLDKAELDKKLRRHGL